MYQPFILQGGLSNILVVITQQIIEWLFID